jgi:hypothetical protein
MTILFRRKTFFVAASSLEENSNHEKIQSDPGRPVWPCRDAASGITDPIDASCARPVVKAARARNAALEYQIGEWPWLTWCN